MIKKYNLHPIYIILLDMLDIAIDIKYELI